MQLPTSPAILGQGFQQGLAIGGELQRTALDAAQIRAQQNDLQMNQKPIVLDQFAKNIPSYLQKPMLDYAAANGVIEQNGDMKFIRASKAKELLSGFKNDMVAQAAVYEQANKNAMDARGELQAKYDDHKSRVDAWMAQKQAEAQNAMIDDPSNPGKKIVDQAKRYKIEAEIKKFQTENPDAVAIQKLKPQIDELGNVMMSTNTVQKTLDDRFVSLEKSLGKYTIPYMSGKMTRDEAYAKNLEDQQTFALKMQEAKNDKGYTPSFKIAGEAKEGPLKGQTVKIDERTAEMFVDTPNGRVSYGGGIKTPAERSVEIRVSNEGSGAKIPSGFRRSADGNLEAIPGGPADLKRQQQYNKESAAVDGVTSELDRLAAAANQLKNHPGLDGITGIKGKIPNIPGSKAANAEALLETLKSQTAFSVLQTMRNNSKTGGALGQVSDKEGQLLQNNLAALDKAQSASAYRDALQKIIDYTDKSKERLKKAYDSNWNNSESNIQTSGSRNNTIVPPKQAIADLKRNPKTAAQFDEIFGQGASKKYLGGR
jgi:hypothetical protein